MKYLKKKEEDILHHTCEKYNMNLADYQLLIYDLEVIRKKH